MCELLGISAKTPHDFRKVLREFYRHSVTNPHGWGMMYSEKGSMQVVREMKSADESEKMEKLVAHLEPQRIVMAHIRYATVGGKREHNCHPFVGKDISGREWTLIHNGTIYSGSMIAKYAAKQEGDTDSERMFLYLIDEINGATTRKGEALEEKERFAVIDGAICKLAYRNKLNLMLYDGELLYAHKNMKNTLAFKRQRDSILLATKPTDDGNWLGLPMTRLLGFRNGKILYQGTDHGHVFVSSLENITCMDAMNI